MLYRLIDRVGSRYINHARLVDRYKSEDATLTPLPPRFIQGNRVEPGIERGFAPKLVKMFIGDDERGSGDVFGDGSVPDKYCKAGQQAFTVPLVQIPKHLDAYRRPPSIKPRFLKNGY